MNSLIYGQDRYLVQQRLQQRIKEVSTTEESEVNFYDASLTGFNIIQVLEEANTISLFSNNKVIVIENCTFLTQGGSLKDYEQDELIRYLENPSAFIHLFFFHPYDNVMKSKKLTKSIMKYGRVDYVEKMDIGSYRAFAKNLLKKNKTVMSDTAFERFIERMDQDMMRTVNECEKLSLYGEEIDESTLELLISRPLENEAFHLVNAMMDNDLKRSLNIYRDMRVLNAEPLSFSALIASQLRLIYQLSCLNQAGYYQRDINELLGKDIHPYRIKKGLELVYKTNPDALLSCLNLLAEYDRKAKQGLVDRFFGFELFLIEASRIWNH